MFLTLGAAAKQAGLSKTTISRAIKTGKLSAERCPDTNSFKIHPSELHRFTEAAQVVRGGQSATAETLPEPQVELRVRCEVAEAKLALTEKHLDDMRADRDLWREQATEAQAAVTRLLPAPSTPPERRGLRRWWRRAG